MRFIPLLLVTVLGACATTSESAPFPVAQAIVDGVAARHSELVRLTLHAVPTGGTECTQLASTMSERRGRPSDPEDLEALRTGEEIVLDEPGAIDVSVPILAAGGPPTAIAGVTLRTAPGADRSALLAKARAIAAELEAELAAEVRSAGQPLW